MPAAHAQEFISEARRGSHDAFRVLVQRHMKQAYDVAYSILGNHDDADDVTQEAFVKVHRSLANFRGDSDFSTWLYRIVKNCGLNRLKQTKRKQRREVELAIAENEVEGNPSVGLGPTHEEAALQSIGNSGGSEARDVLRKFALSSQDDRLTRMAVYALGNSQNAADTSFYFDVLRNGKSMEVRKAALYQLSNVLGASGVSTLARIVKDENNEELRVAAIMCLVI